MSYFDLEKGSMIVYYILILKQEIILLFMFTLCQVMSCFDFYFMCNNTSLIRRRREHH